MNIIFRKLFKSISPEEEGKTLLGRANASAFSIFQDEGFRKLAVFFNQSQVEQDRIFNELCVTAIIYLMFIIEGKLYFERVVPERIRFWNSLHDMIPDLYVNYLKSLGIDEQNASIWKKLIQMRHREYKDNRRITRSAWTKELATSKVNPEFDEMAVRLETLTVGALDHITRGQAGPDFQDPLRRHLRTWLSTLEARLYKRVGW